MLIDSATKTKILYNKDEALIRMIALGETMKMANGKQYYCYRDGAFYSSLSKDFAESNECNINNLDSSNNWIRVS